jgi:hypothetical protein
MNFTIEFIAKLLIYTVFSYYMIEYIVNSRVNTAIGFISLMIINIMLLIMYIFYGESSTLKTDNIVSRGANLMTV